MGIELWVRLRLHYGDVLLPQFFMLCIQKDQEISPFGSPPVLAGYLPSYVMGYASGHTPVCVEHTHYGVQ